MSDAPKKPHEAVRNTLDLIRSALESMSVEHRAEVLAALEIKAGAELLVVGKMLDDARENAEEWKKHNEQRFEEVQAARVLLNAQPNETLPMAIERFKKEKTDGNVP